MNWTIYQKSSYGIHCQIHSLFMWVFLSHKKLNRSSLSCTHLSFSLHQFPFLLWSNLTKILLCNLDPSTAAIGLSCVPWHLQEETMRLPRWGLKLLNRTKRSSSKRSPTSMVSPIFLLGSIEVSRVLSCLFFFFFFSKKKKKACWSSGHWPANNIRWSSYLICGPRCYGIALGVLEK